MGIKLGHMAKKAAPALIPAFLAACSGPGMDMPDLRGGSFNTDRYAHNVAPTPPTSVADNGITATFDPIAAAIRQAEINTAVAGALESSPYANGPDFSVVSDTAITMQRVNYTGAEPAGTVLIDDSYNKLYLIEEDGTAIQYPVAMGREGHEMPNVQYVITHGREWPSWTPTPTMHNAGQTVPGGPNNPLGARALYLAELHPDGSTEATYYRIHGTNAPDSIGTDASGGCVRMRNEDVSDIFARINRDDGIPNLVRLATPQDLGHFSRIPTARAQVAHRATPGRPNNG